MRIAEDFFRAALGLDGGREPQPCPDTDGRGDAEHDAVSDEAFAVGLDVLRQRDGLAGVLADLLPDYLPDGPPSARRGTVKSFFRGHGWDVLAFYRPFHAAPETWGIHYRLDRFLELTARVLGEGIDEYQRDPQYALLDLVHLTWFHEFFHFRTEFALTHAEVASGRELYCAYRAWYQRTLGTKKNISEALATATKFRDGAEDLPALVELLKTWSPDLPAGYRDWGTYATDEAYREGLRSLMLVIVQGSWPGTGELLEYELAEPYEESVPEYLVIDPARLPAYAVDFFGVMAPASVRTLPIKKVEKHARRNGATIETGRGGHATYVVKGGDRRPLAKHGGKKELVHFEIKSLAELFQLDRNEYVAQVLRA